MLTFYQALYSIVIGLVQGISEWLPISSKTQVLVASQYLLGLTFSEAYTFGLFMEIGTMIAAVVYFRKELLTLINVLAGRSRDRVEKDLFVYVVVTTVVTGMIGVPFYLIADSITGVSLGIPMLVIGIVLIADALVIRHSRKRQRDGLNLKRFKDLGFRDYILIGISQGIAALPGVSRSGITTSALLLMKVEAKEAFRLSFLIGIFASAAAFSLTLIVSRANVMAALAGISLTGIFIAIITSAIVSIFLIDFLIKISGKSRIVYVTGALGAIAIGSGLLYVIFGI